MIGVLTKFPDPHWVFTSNSRAPVFYTMKGIFTFSSVNQAIEIGDVLYMLLYLII